MSAPVEHKIVAARFGTIAGTEVSLFRIPNSTNDYIAVVKVFGENKNLLKKIRLLSVN